MSDAQVLRGRPVAEARLEGVRAVAVAYEEAGSPLTLVTVLVGDDPASAMYVSMKQQEAAELGIRSLDVRLEASTGQLELEERLSELSGRDDVDAILVQYPLPRHLDYLAALLAIDPHKDVDGLHPVNLGLLAAGAPAIHPCTPRGIVELLGWYGVEIPGRRVAILGRGLTVGRPLSILLSDKRTDGNATVTLLHTGSHIDDVASEVAAADVVIAAAGQRGLVRPEWIKPGAVLVAAGVSFRDGVAISDFAKGSRDHAGAYTPTTGGVGPMTRAWLFQNVVECRRSSE